MTGIAFAVASVAIAGLSAYSFAGWLRLQSTQARVNVESLAKLERDFTRLREDFDVASRKTTERIANLR